MFNTLKKDLCKPFDTITKQPYHFICWFLVAIVLGLLSLWITIFQGYLDNLDLNLAFGEFLNGKNLATFSIVILAEGIAGALLSINSGKTDTAVGIRGIAGIISIVIIVFLALVVWSYPSTDPLSRVNRVQILLTIFAVFLAVYMYCFRSAEWEKSADQVRQQEDADVAVLDKAAASTSVDKNGAIL